MAGPTANPRTARRTHGFTESVIREMTRVANLHGSINLAQGFPDFPAPELLKEAACRAIRDDVNQYAITWGAPRLRRALAAQYERLYGMTVDEQREITVTCGATEAMAAALLAVVDPGDEVIVLEPFYENYGPDAVLCGARPVWVPLEPVREVEADPASPRAPGHPGLRFELDLDRLAAAFGSSTRAIVLNTPNNPTGRVFTRAELEAIAELCLRHDVIAFTDEIYEHIRYRGEHVPLAALPGMRARTVTVSGASKTFSVTGWRIGTIVAPEDLTAAIRKVHDFLTVGAPAPLQEACAEGLESLGEDYYRDLARDYRERRDVLHSALVAAGFRCSRPDGAYYILADFSDLSPADDVAFALALAAGDLAGVEGSAGVEASAGADARPAAGPGPAAASRQEAGAGGGAGVATVPGSSFFHDPALGRRLVRFAFCKRLETLRDAGRALVRITGRGAAAGPAGEGRDSTPDAPPAYGSVGR